MMKPAQGFATNAALYTDLQRAYALCFFCCSPLHALMMLTPGCVLCGHFHVIEVCTSAASCGKPKLEKVNCNTEGW